MYALHDKCSYAVQQHVSLPTPLNVYICPLQLFGSPQTLTGRSQLRQERDACACLPLSRSKSYLAGQEMLPTPGVKHPLGTVSADTGECEKKDEVQADKSEGFKRWDLGLLKMYVRIAQTRK